MHVGRHPIRSNTFHRHKARVAAQRRLYHLPKAALAKNDGFVCAVHTRLEVTRKHLKFRQLCKLRVCLGRRDAPHSSTASRGVSPSFCEALIMTRHFRTFLVQVARLVHHVTQERLVLQQNHVPRVATAVVALVVDSSDQSASQPDAIGAQFVQYRTVAADPDSQLPERHHLDFETRDVFVRRLDNVRKIPTKLLSDELCQTLRTRTIVCDEVQGLLDALEEFHQRGVFPCVYVDNLAT
mmetsp:Transcript_7010/g.10981  ORF Transcript_7010/g.10981 Transcript_7010/m.10981 type:complete len:239 (+) Transcript_7010:985-1701(+)